MTCYLLGPSPLPHGPFTRGPTVAASGAAAAAGAAGAEPEVGQSDGREGGVEGEESDAVGPLLRRPSYRRADGAPFVIKWQEGSGWGVHQVVPVHSVVFQCTNLEV